MPVYYTCFPNKHRFLTLHVVSRIKASAILVGSRRQEQLSSRCQQRIVATVEESVLRMEMAGLESQEEDVSQRVLFYKTMTWLGQIRPHRRDESWSASL